MSSLLVITPSRGRPARLCEMLDATLSLAELDTRAAVAIDQDDLALDEYTRARCLKGDEDPRVLWFAGPRQTLSGWTNQIALKYADEYGYLASLGDDHFPRTQGWDRLLVEAIEGIGGTGIAYGDDNIMGAGLPTAPVISSDIVQALGWMMLPSCRHMAVDLAWKDLGLGADCLAYRPDVTIEHKHWGVSKSPLDATYMESEARKQEDRDAWTLWQQTQMNADVAKVRAAKLRSAVRRVIAHADLGSCETHDLQPLPVVDFSLDYRCAPCNGTVRIPWTELPFVSQSPDDVTAAVRAVAKERPHADV